jgi:hypothetical protein
MTKLNILQRRPRPGHYECEYVLVDRGEGAHQRYVVGTINENSSDRGEWFWGHYFDTVTEAAKYFEEAK